jgi:hypothetical protein
MQKLITLATSLLFLLTSKALAQSPLTCATTQGTPPLIRAEGRSETVSDLVLTCSGGSPGASGSRT